MHTLCAFSDTYILSFTYHIVTENSKKNQIIYFFGTSLGQLKTNLHIIELETQRTADLGEKKL